MNITDLVQVKSTTFREWKHFDMATNEKFLLKKNKTLASEKVATSITWVQKDLGVINGHRKLLMGDDSSPAFCLGENSLRLDSQEHPG